MPQAITKITTVRIAVAKLELIFSMPILAKIVVNAAKIAESIAKIHQAFSDSIVIQSHSIFVSIYDNSSLSL